MGDILKFGRPESKPDDEHVCREFKDGKVVTTYRFCGSYKFDGAEWCFDIWAENLEEAQAKLRAVSAGKIDGQVYSVIPA